MLLGMGIAALGATSAVAGRTYFETDAYGMRQYLDDQLYRYDGSLKECCVSEEQTGRLTTTCKKYKHDLNRLLRNQLRKNS